MTTEISVMYGSEKVNRTGRRNSVINLSVTNFQLITKLYIVISSSLNLNTRGGRLSGLASKDSILSALSVSHVRNVVLLCKSAFDVMMSVVYSTNNVSTQRARTFSTGNNTPCTTYTAAAR